MLSTQLLREQLDRYAAGAISADALEEWLTAESWDMRRWVPIGLQRLIEATQAVFIQYSDGHVDSDQLRNYLLTRRDQLHRALKITEELKLSRQRLEDAIRHGSRLSESISGTEALSLKPELVSA